MRARKKPNNTLKNITPSKLLEEAACRTLVGTTFRRVSATVTDARAVFLTGEERVDV